MIVAPLLDTHAWIWWMDRDQRLGWRAIEALDALPNDSRPYLSDISVWEVAMLVDRGRVGGPTRFGRCLGAWDGPIRRPTSTRPPDPFA